MVDRNALGEPGNVVLDEQSDLDTFKEWARAGKSENMMIWPQINHPGKQSPDFLSPEPVAPSAIPLDIKDSMAAKFKRPRELTESDIRGIIHKFATTARLCKEIGFDGVQIHAAHGYLVSQFLSPRHNQRKDQWGGSLENRTRFLIEIYREIREAVGDGTDGFCIGVKLNSSDFMKGGFSEEDSMKVIKKLSDEGVDLIEISGGGYEEVTFLNGIENPREAFFLNYAENVRKVSDAPLVVTGGFRSTAGMNDALKNDATDFIGISRPLSADPDFSNKVLEGKHYRTDLKARSTGIKKLDRMTMIDFLWHQQQIVRMSNAQEPDPNLSEWKAIWTNIKAMGRYSFRRMRA